jgi:hypothetical protein
MKKIKLIFLLVVLNFADCGFAQPWLNPLLIATSTDGTNFSTPQIFQDSSGVPSVIQLNNGNLICAFQWFPAPINSQGWDSIAVKMSTDNGVSWTAPTSVNVAGIPGGFQRPFDPTLVETDAGQIRMFFSCGPMGMGLDSNINTYSAISSDGVNYVFEGGIRFDDLNNPVIDPACTKWNGTWHYTAPVGAPQDGAHHATSTDGINFTEQADIPSDFSHNWTGNLMIDSTQMKFYGSGASIWWNATSDGLVWSGYTNTNIPAGGDPSVVKLPDGTYLMIYVGPPGFTSIEEEEKWEIKVYPNPVNDELLFSVSSPHLHILTLYNLQGKLLLSKKVLMSATVDVSTFANGVYIVEVISEETGRRFIKKIVKE